MVIIFFILLAMQIIIGASSLVGLPSNLSILDSWIIIGYGIAIFCICFFSYARNIDLRRKLDENFHIVILNLGFSTFSFLNYLHDFLPDENKMAAMQTFGPDPSIDFSELYAGGFGFFLLLLAALQIAGDTPLFNKPREILHP